MEKQRFHTQRLIAKMIQGRICTHKIKYVLGLQTNKSL